MSGWVKGVRAGPCLPQPWIVITQGNVRVSREISFELRIPKGWIWKPLNLHNFSPLVRGFPHSSVGKESACNAGDPGSIPGSGRSPGEGNGNPLQYSCLENPMDRGAWQATAHGVTRVGHNLTTKPPPPLVRTTRRLQGFCSVGKMCVLSWVSQSVSSIIQSCQTLCDPTDCSRSGFPICHQLLELAQTHVHWISDAIQPSHPLSSPSPPAFNLSQDQGHFQWVSSSHQVAKVLELQLQYQSFQWIFRTDFL